MNKVPLFVVGGIILALLVWAFAPAGIVHWFLFDVLWLGLPFYAPLAVLIAVTLLSLAYREWFAGLVFVLGFIGVVVWWFYVPAQSQYKLTQTYDPVYVETIPTSSNVRYMPMPVAMQLASSKYQDPRHHINDLDPIELASGDIGWTGARVPTGIINYFTGQVQGTLTVTPDGKVYTTDQTFACGEGMGVTDNIRWKLWRERYSAVLDEYYYITINDELYLMAPYVQYKLDGVVFVPEWGGVFVVDGDCHIEDLSPSEAMKDPRLAGQRIVPEEYAKRVANAWQYKNGISNAWFYHVDQTEVPTIDGENNQMPYLIPTTIGEQWFIALEPYGPAFSIYKMIFVDAFDATVRVYEYPADSAIISPNKVAGFIKAANPTYDWTSVVVLEPRPLIVDEILYWMMSQTSTDYSGVEQTFLLRSTDEEVLAVRTYDELVQFMSEGELDQATIDEIQAAVEANGGAVPDDLSQYTTEQLHDLLLRVAQELNRR